MRSPALGYDNEAGIALRPIVALFLIVFVVVAGFAIVMPGDKYHWGWTEISVHYASRSASRSEGSRYSGVSVPFQGLLRLARRRLDALVNNAQFRGGGPWRSPIDLFR